MKKRTVLLLALVALFAIFTCSVSAATPSDRILEAAKTFPFASYHIVQIENGLKNIADAGIEITDADADAIIAAMEELRVYGDKCAYDFDKLTNADREAILTLLNKGAGVIGCSIKFADDHDGIWEIILYAPNGEVIDVYSSAGVVKQTGSDNTAIFAAASVLVITAAAAVVFFRKKNLINEAA